MHVKTRNVNTAFSELVWIFSRGADPSRGGQHCEPVPIVRRSSRYGPVLYVEEPVTVTCSRPLERVLFNEARDVNPFALLYESLWMLAGRRDVAPLAHYTPRFAEFSDDGKVLNAAYGYRWRTGGGQATDAVRYDGRFCQQHEFGSGYDQLKLLVQHLRDKPDSRRAVLQMWNVEDDLMVVDTSKDVCCNLSVLFFLRETDEDLVLDVTVLNRSNDLVWGMLGADHTCFSVLQEYVAAHLGVRVGVYHQVTNNLHVYLANWRPDEWLAWGRGVEGSTIGAPYVTLDGQPRGQFVPLVSDPVTFDRELPRFVQRFSGAEDEPFPSATSWMEPFLNDVAAPMMSAFRCHKLKDYRSAMRYVGDIKADDWRIVCEGWLRRRAEKRADGLRGAAHTI